MEIPGLAIVPLTVQTDGEGWFTEAWHRGRMVAAGLPGFTPVQHNLRHLDRRGVTRGFYAEPWNRLISVARGRAFGAWVDLRPGQSFGATATAELDTAESVFVPKGVANSFQILEDHTTISTLLDAHWTPEARATYSTLNLFDPALGIEWPIPESWAIVSPADAANPLLADAVPFGAVGTPAQRAGVEGEGAPAAPPSPRRRAFKLLFVCTANICRSAYADVAANAAGPAGIQFSSAGTRALVGEGIDPPMALELTAGAEPELHRARQVTRALVEEADLVLTMAAEHRRYILDEWPAMGRKTYVIGHAARVLAELPAALTLDGVTGHLWGHRTVQEGDEVRDPYRRGQEAARQAASEIDGHLAVILGALGELIGRR